MEMLISDNLNVNQHMLSLCGKVTIFSCKRVSDLMFCSFSYKHEENRFVRASDGAAVISRKSSTRVVIVKCQCATDLRKRAATQCVLVAKRSQKSESFHYVLLTVGSSGLEPHIEFKLPYRIRDSVSILQGPTVLWSHAGNVFYMSLQAGQVRQIPMQLSHSVCGELPLQKAQIFILGKQNLTKEQVSSTVGSQTLGYFLENGDLFDSSMLLPHPYISITQCIIVLSAEKEYSRLRTAVVAATSKQQLVYFENGIVKDVCRLPFEHPEAIQLANTGRNGCLFVVWFHQGHVCAVRKDTFQVASHWSGVSSVHVDDFVGCGTDQILLVFGDQSVTGRWLDNFLITDLCGISYSRGQDNGVAETPPPPAENHLLTLRALESRLQSGLTVLQDLQREVRVKDRVLMQSIRALTDVVSDKEPTLTQHEEESLIALWDDDDESKDDVSVDRTQEMPAASSNPQVDKLWHRVIEGRVIVGVILATNSSTPVASVSLSVLTEMGQSSAPAVIQTHSQVFWLTTLSASSFPSSSPSEPVAKRSRRHSAGRPGDLSTCGLAVTAVTSLTPLLNSGCVKCHVLLHYVHHTRDSFGLVSNTKPAVLHCGHVALHSRSYFQTQLLTDPKLKTGEVKEDFLSLLAVLDQWVFLVDSPDHSLGDIDDWMEKRTASVRIAVSPEYLLFNSSQLSDLMLLRWNQITPFQGELSVHSRLSNPCATLLLRP
ncbi:Fanconi anemia group B protein isoform X2 [Thalassophryne amazonica]|uniref:Fanconi anemia group B protein isoform X2 n=1 Tax=Thalassophryne amazonica TaxID=390379 RepID=UPI001471549A|nr:Fanconi anemia group B protein isoform X2 [Thalassophryne amazonica]